MSVTQPVTDRQLAASVRFGRKITFTVPEFSSRPITGYVSGWDEENIFVAIPQSLTVRKILLHRDWIRGMELHDESTMSVEQPVVRKQLDNLISRFRDRIIDEYFPNRS